MTPQAMIRNIPHPQTASYSIITQTSSLFITLHTTAHEEHLIDVKDFLRGSDVLPPIQTQQAANCSQ